MQPTIEDMKRNHTVEKCKICGGSGIIYGEGAKMICKQPGRVLFGQQGSLCICRRNELIENSSSYFNSKYCPLISDETAKNSFQKYSYNENFVFTGKEFLFLNICKSVFVHARLNSSLEFNILSGLEIVQNYYVEQEAGALRTLDDLINRTHLLVILCTTNLANKVLAKVVQQVVESRNRIGRGTWIYAPENFSSKTEYSPDLINATLKWKTINL